MEVHTVSASDVLHYVVYIRLQEDLSLDCRHDADPILAKCVNRVDYAK